MSSELLTSLISSLLVIVFAGVLYGQNGTDQKSKEEHATQRSSSSGCSKIPFIVWQEPNWNLLIRTADEYETHNRQLLGNLSQGLNILQKSYPRTAAWDTQLLQDSLQRRIHRLADVLFQDETVLRQKLLVPFKFTLAIAPPRTSYTSSAATQNNNQNQVSGGPVDHSYDQPFQVVAHLIRDWTVEGYQIRASIYDWCVQQIPADDHYKSILVPGAGMGRLAWDIATQSPTMWSVEALESSNGMVAAAAAILQRQQIGVIHPYGADHLNNEVDSNRRHHEVIFPDVDTNSKRTGHLSYTLGDFLMLSQLSGYQHSFDVLVTCFFLDTATNVLDYIRTIQAVVKPGGRWINVGPLQWHLHSELRFSADELHKLLIGLKFEILEWSIDATPIEYRSQTLTSTHYDAYCPLRFVVLLPLDGCKRTSSEQPVV